MAGNRGIHAALADRDVQVVELTHAHAREFAVQVGEADKGASAALQR